MPSDLCSFIFITISPSQCSGARTVSHLLHWHPLTPSPGPQQYRHSANMYLSSICNQRSYHSSASCLFSYHWTELGVQTGWRIVCIKSAGHHQVACLLNPASAQKIISIYLNIYSLYLNVKTFNDISEISWKDFRISVLFLPLGAESIERL